MKRALSLIIALAMVLCMVPFSAFAADFGLADGYLADGVITLVGSEEQTYLWTATEDGTLAINTNGAEGTDIYIQVDGENYTEAFSVTAGKSYEITIGDDNGAGGEVEVYTVFTGLPGTETNPKVLAYPLTPMYPNPTTDAIESGVTEYYVLQGYGNQEVVISGLGVKVVTVADGAVYGGEATTESVTFTVPAGQMYYVLKITNKAEAAQTYTVSTVVKVGTMDNPEVVTDGTYTADLEADNQGYYYSYTAEGDGTVNVSVSAADAEGNALATIMGVSNLTSYVYNDQTEAGSDSIAVSAGDNLQIFVATYNADDMWNAPAGTVVTTISFEAAESEDGAIVIEALPYTAEHTGVYDQDYTYTATEAGYLYVASEGWMSVNSGNTWAEGYGDGYVLAMNEDDVANINLYAYWGEETFTYEFTWLTEITPDGSYGFPLEVGTLLNGEVTLVNDGEEALYYTYTAEKSGEIYNSFYEEANAVAEGETVMFYVPAGGITIFYLPAVAMIGDVEYTSLANAVSAAVSGDSIVLVANVTEEAGILLPTGVELDLGAYTLTIPYLVAALKGSAVTGNPSTATIVTEDLVANVVEIDGVEYAWTESEAGYILDVYTAPVVGEEDAIVAEYNGEQMGLAAAITAAGAVATADAPATVTLISDATVTYNVVIEPNVILNIGAYTLTAPNVIGLSGSKINATSGLSGGKIIVPSSSNMALSDEVHAGTAANSYLLPVWNADHYVFTQVRNRTNKFAVSSGTTYLIQLRHYWDDDAKTLLTDGNIAENGVKFIAQASWYYGELKVTQEYYFGATSSGNAASGSNYGGTADTADLTSYTMQGQIITDCGAVVYWSLHEI